MLRPEAIVFTRSAENSAFSEGPSEMKTTSPTGSGRRLNVPPNSRRQRSMRGSAAR